MPRLAPLVVAACLVSSPALAQESGWKATCASVAAVPAPVDPVVVSAASDDTLKGCDAADLYYGIEHPANPPAALRCAAYHVAHASPSAFDPLSAGVLAMIYANGRGAPRSYDLAIRYACGNTWTSESDKALQVPHLAALRAGDRANPVFDVCMESSGTWSADACAALDERRNDITRAERLSAVVRTLPAAARTALPDLQRAEREFEESRSATEIDASGTGAPVFIMEDARLLRDQFVINLERFAKGDVPEVATAQLQATEREIDAFMERIHGAPSAVWEGGTVHPDGIDRTERAWLALRNAWLVFARVAYPRLSVNRVASQIDRLRIHQLQSLAPR